MADTIGEQIEDSALGPRRAQGDMGSVEQHSLPDQIAADKYLLSKSRFASGKIKLHTMRMISPGGNGNQ